MLIYQQSYMLGYSWKIEQDKAKNYQETLETFGFFNREVTRKDIQTRYHELAIQYHPDKQPRGSSTDETINTPESDSMDMDGDSLNMETINQAYEILNQNFH